MKKFLLLSMLVGGIGGMNAFAVAGSAFLKVQVEGDIVAPTGTDLVINPTTHTGPQGMSMEFNFADMTKGSSREETGTFTIERNDKSSLIDTSESITVGLAKDATGTILQTQENKVGTNSEVTLNYVINQGQKTDKKYEGSLAVKATVADDAAEGSFNDNTMMIVVQVK